MGVPRERRWAMSLTCESCANHRHHVAPRRMQLPRELRNKKIRKEIANLPEKIQLRWSWRVCSFFYPCCAAGRTQTSNLSLPNGTAVKMKRYSTEPKRRSFASKLARAWLAVGFSLAVLLTGWSLIAYRASGEAKKAILSDPTVAVERGDGCWIFTPTTSKPKTRGLIFFPGSLVEPSAYAPLLRKVALNGHVAALIELPWRGTFAADNNETVAERVRVVMGQQEGVATWALAGHSKGGAIAGQFCRLENPQVAGLILLGTSHPRDISLANTKVHVTKVIGTKDGFASLEKCEQNRRNLPTSTDWIVIEGGNHSQFGDYGFQPGDRFAAIKRSEQQKIVAKAILANLGR